MRAALVALLLAGPPVEPLWTTLPPEPAAVGTACLASFTELLERARPAVVAVHTDTADAVPGDPLGLLPGAHGIGSGFVLRSDGLIATNHHVIASAKAVSVRVLNIAHPFPAEILGSDPSADLALLRIRAAEPLPVLPLGDSDTLRPGAWVVAIGNPFGLTHVATKGIVSGKGRALERDRIEMLDFIQTDASIDHGNSGGPLLNLRGEVVGINTAINKEARGIGFAVPINLVKAVLPHLHQSGRLVRSYLGVTIDDVDAEIARSFGLDRPRGAVVTEVRPGSPAERAGLQQGDVVLRFAGTAIARRTDLTWRAATWPAYVPAALSVWRDRAELPLVITPVSRSASRHLSGAAAEPVAQILGLKVLDVTQKLAAEVDLATGIKGVVVVASEAKALEHDLRVGDVITEINGMAVESAEAFERALDRIPAGESVRFYLHRHQDARFVAIRKTWR